MVQEVLKIFSDGENCSRSWAPWTSWTSDPCPTRPPTRRLSSVDGYSEYSYCPNAHKRFKARGTIVAQPSTRVYTVLP